jgi:hypothetical protein
MKIEASWSVVCRAPAASSRLIQLSDQGPSLPAANSSASKADTLSSACYLIIYSNDEMGVSALVELGPRLVPVTIRHAWVRLSWRVTRVLEDWTTPR